MPQQIGWSVESKLIYQLQQQVARIGGKVTLKQYPTLGDFPPTGDTNTIYLALDTSQIYYWDESASAYVEISAAPITPSVVNLFNYYNFI